MNGSGTSQSVSPNTLIKNESVNQNLLYFFIPLFLFALIILGIIWLNYFGVISLKDISPSLGILPTKNTRTAILMGDEEITYREYKDVLDYVRQSIADKKISIARTRNLFITNKLLKNELEKRGKNFDENAFRQFLSTTTKVENLNISSGLRLEYENTFLKDQIFTDAVSWYTGEYFLVRFENPDLNIPEEEKKKRALVKIEEIRKEMLNAFSFEKIAKDFKDDEELNTLNANQGFGGQFTKMSLGSPTIKAPEFLETLKKLKLNEVSEVITISDPNRKGRSSPVPFAYSVIRLIDSNAEGAPSFEEWLNQTVSQTEIKFLIN